MVKRYKDITGKRFGRLVAQKYAYTDQGHRTAVWLCKCDCGKNVYVRSDSLNGGTKSCGCLQKEKVSVSGAISNLKHGKYKHRLYNIHQGIKARCFKPACPAYKNYGGRGITMCDEWKKYFMSFYQWAVQNGYKDNLTIDRINNDGDYCPDNCRWVDHKTQGRNTRANHLLTYNGETHCLKEWAEKIGIRYYHIWWRMQHNWPIEKVLSKSTRRK